MWAYREGAGFWGSLSPRPSIWRGKGDEPSGRGNRRRCPGGSLPGRRVTVEKLDKHTNRPKTKTANKLKISREGKKADKILHPPYPRKGGCPADPPTPHPTHPSTHSQCVILPPPPIPPIADLASPPQSCDCLNLHQWGPALRSVVKIGTNGCK